jgi:signal transduction histidine kinase
MSATELPQRSFRAAITRFTVVGFVALLGVLVSTGVLMAMSQQQTRAIVHTYQVQRELDAIRLTTTALIGVRLSNRLIASHRGTQRAAQLQAALEQSIVRLGQLTNDNPRQQARIPLLMASAARVERKAGLDVPVEAPAGTMSDDPGDVIAALCTAMMDEETRLMDARQALRTELGRDFFIILGLTGVLLAVVAILTYVTVNSYTREIAASRQALHDANTGLEAAVRERTTELMRVNAEIQRFAYIVSHDLRSPLVNIIGFTAEMESATQLLRERLDMALAERPGTVSPQVETAITRDMPEAIAFIGASAKKMDRLINAILQLSRLGRRALNPQWLNLEDVIKAVIDTLQVLVTQAGASIDIVQPMPELLADRVALEQILANLVENAIKYRHTTRKLEVRISAQRVGDRVLIAVADNGRGIDPRDRERVFDLFRRSGVQDQSGEGIGLAHVRALAYRMGGSIALESTLGEGSAFTLTLPVHFQDTRALESGELLQ